MNYCWFIDKTLDKSWQGEYDLKQTLPKALQDTVAVAKNK